MDRIEVNNRSVVVRSSERFEGREDQDLSCGNQSEGGNGDQWGSMGLVVVGVVWVAWAGSGGKGV